MKGLAIRMVLGLLIGDRAVLSSHYYYALSK